MCLRKDIGYYRGAIFSSCIMVSCLALPACSLMLVLCWLVLMLMLTLAPPHTPPGPCQVEFAPV